MWTTKQQTSFDTQKQTYKGVSERKPDTAQHI